MQLIVHNKNYLDREKKFSSDKLIPRNFDWNIATFNLLGIKFSVNLPEMLELNFLHNIAQIRKLVSHWNKRYLTPLGKITVIKSIFLSKLNHLFSSLPNPHSLCLETLNDIFFKFIWSNKPDKIKRDVTMLDYHKGGLKMIKLEYAVMSSKISWIKRLFHKNTPWIKLFRHTILGDLQQIINFGPEYGSILKRKTCNLFWLDTFSSWETLNNKIAVSSNVQISSSPIWYNKKLTDEYLYFPAWYKKGIVMISDVLDTEGNILERNELKDHYKLDSVNFLDYLRLSRAVKGFIKMYKIGNYEKTFGPFMPNSLWLLNFKGPKGFYNQALNTHQNHHSAKAKWEKTLNITINDEMWKQIFKVCHKSLQNNEYIWFQMRIIYRILGTRSYLANIHKIKDATCTRCKSETETILHMFVACPMVKELWNTIKKYIKNRIGLTVSFSAFNIIFGHTLTDHNQIPFNTMLLVTKKCIFDAAIKERNLNTEMVMSKF